MIKFRNLHRVGQIVEETLIHQTVASLVGGVPETKNVVHYFLTLISIKKLLHAIHMEYEM